MTTENGVQSKEKRKCKDSKARMYREGLSKGQKKPQHDKKQKS